MTRGPPEQKCPFLLAELVLGAEELEGSGTNPELRGWDEESAEKLERDEAQLPWSLPPCILAGEM